MALVRHTNRTEATGWVCKEACVPILYLKIVKHFTKELKTLQDVIKSSIFASDFHIIGIIA